MLDSIDRALSFALAKSESLSLVAVRIGGIALFFAALMVVVDVVLRRFSSVTLGGADEISSYAFAVSISWGLSLALLRRSHIRVDFLYVLLPLKARAILDAVASLSLAVLAFLLTRWGGMTVMESWRFGATSNSNIVVPLWLPQGIWVVGFAFFLVVCILIFLKCVVLLLQGKDQEAHQVFGILSVQEEAEVESKEALQAL
ncbi:TRAP transporter small permease [Chelatococcus sp. YT9]|uniref:TRAP transporter small permease subunit n=1 Tax=Chelatococcus sp. YT9 TaxID=2835635 RepID=UPI001BCFC2F8|nr:TRAP transporter small permease [Chelatococcus sp. YT9]MBS7697459.1 TRAP transporter small permease [Chelatococcus sp. YT9]